MAELSIEEGDAPGAYKNYDLAPELQQPQQPAAGPAPKPPGSSHVEIFVRVRPVPSPSPRLTWEEGEGKLDFTIPREASAGLINNQREHYEFRFNGIIGPQANQDEVREYWGTGRGV
jgi:hypothetical protein